MKLLDHGYVELIETWGSDKRIIEAARMSTNKGFQGWKEENYYECKICNYTCSESLIENKAGKIPCPSEYKLDHVLYDGMILIETKPGDEKLLSYLYNHKHMTPFEMAGMIIEVQAPIFVFREWHRHRTQSYNELSARYTELPNMFYIPSIERLCNSQQGIKNRQGSDAGFDPETAQDIQTLLEESYSSSRRVYEGLLKENVSREVARLVIPVAQYSRMRASANLRNWLQFLTLRMDKNAQWEIRQYANAVGDLISSSFPRTWELFKGEQK